MFWLKSNEEEWISLKESALRRELKARGLRDKAHPQEGEMINPIDGKIRDIEQAKRVEFACALAGYRAGVHEVAGHRLLVTRIPRLIKSKKGDWPLIAKVLSGMFCGTDETESGCVDIDQRDRILGWLQHLVNSLYSGRVTRGLCLCLAGEPDCGKTFFAMMLREITGGRVAKPYDFMIGRDDFNRELFEAPLLLIDDENADTRIESRKAFGAQIKKIVANADVKLRGMHRDGIVINPTWRLVILVNLEAERLIVLPPVDNDIRDKLLMVKAYRRPRPASDASEDERACWPMPMPTRNEDERMAFWNAIRAELPAFLHFLLEEYSAPSSVLGGRWFVQDWQHPEILRELQQFSPHVRLWQLIHRSEVVFRQLISGENEPLNYKDLDEWSGTADALEKLLKGPDSKLGMDEKREIPKPNWLGQQLKSAEKHWGSNVVRFTRTGKSRTYTLKKHPELAQ
jgi:hypothetical protein